MSCHSTIDPIGYLLGSLEILPSNKKGEGHSFIFPIVNDKSNIKTKKIFNYRDMNGKHYKEPIYNLDDLGKQLTSLPDFNYCISKRYYQFVSGIKVDIKMSMSESNSKSIHILNVKKLSKSFSQHQNLKKLLKEAYSLLAKNEVLP